jgi:hypothetical protein
MTLPVCSVFDPGVIPRMLAQLTVTPGPRTGLMVLDVVRRLVEGHLQELVVARVARHPEVPHAPAARVCFLRRCTDAGFPPDLRHAGPQLMTERAVLRLVIEQRYRHKMIMPTPSIFSRAWPQLSCSKRSESSTPGIAAWSMLRGPLAGPDRPADLSHAARPRARRRMRPRLSIGLVSGRCQAWPDQSGSNARRRVGCRLSNSGSSWSRRQRVGG